MNPLVHDVDFFATAWRPITMPGQELHSGLRSLLWCEQTESELSFLIGRRQMGSGNSLGTLCFHLPIVSLPERNLWYGNKSSSDWFPAAVSKSLKRPPFYQPACLSNQSESRRKNRKAMELKSVSPLALESKSGSAVFCNKNTLKGSHRSTAFSSIKHWTWHRPSVCTKEAHLLPLQLWRLGLLHSAVLFSLHNPSLTKLKATKRLGLGQPNPLHFNFPLSKGHIQMAP